jgi:hypothetical protein
MLTQSKPEQAAKLMEQAQAEVDARFRLYEMLAGHGGQG